jgi:ATP-dependent Zn protease
MSDLGLVAMDPDRIMFGGIGDKVHAEIDGMLNQALQGARQVLIDHRPLFDAVVKELLDEDTVDVDRLKAIWAEVEGQPVEPVAA